MIRISGSIDQYIINEKIRLSKNTNKVKPISPSSSIKSSLDGQKNYNQKSNNSDRNNSFSQELEDIQNRLLRK